MRPKINFILEDDQMPRTIFWQQHLDLLNKICDVTNDDPKYLIPVEDTAIETNWPVYGNSTVNYIRGNNHNMARNGVIDNYYSKIIKTAIAYPRSKIFVLNKHPFYRVPFSLRAYRNIYVADGSLVGFERGLNRRTISFPSMPISTGQGKPLEDRSILASFQGVNSFPIRQDLAKLHDEEKFIIHLIPRDNHVGKIDAQHHVTDITYELLLANSVFAFVPRGDAHFSYRLLEVMSFGCIPIILSDGWILPFDRIVPWNEFSLKFHTEGIPDIPHILKSLTKNEIAQLHGKVQVVYKQYFKDLETITKTLFMELNLLTI